MTSLLHACQSWIRRRSVRRQAAAWRRAHVGAASHIDRSVQVLGWRQVRVGHHTLISEGTWLNVNDRAVDSAVIAIGNNCFIGRRNFFSAGAAIKIGDYSFTGVDCHFLGADHNFASPFVPYLASGTSCEASIEVGANCWIGTSVTVLKGVCIGYGSIVGARSVVTQDVPPFSLAVGHPARVIRRYDVRRGEWVPIADYACEADTALPGEEAYLKMLRSSHPALKTPSIASGYRCGDI